MKVTGWHHGLLRVVSTGPFARVRKIFMGVKRDESDGLGSRVTTGWFNGSIPSHGLLWEKDESNGLVSRVSTGWFNGSIPSCAFQAARSAGSALV